MNKEKKSRHLKVLVIDDNISPDDIDAIQALPIETCEFLDEEIIGSWKQTLNLIQYLKTTKELYDVPDILLVDCDFKRDEASPSISDNQATIDARGLLYGVTLLPFFMALNPYKPLVCQIYTQEINRVAPDGYMQTFYSLLTTLADDDTPEYSQEDMQSCITEGFVNRKEPQTALKLILPNYRNKLKNAILEKKNIFPDRESFKDCAKEIERIIKENNDVSDDMAIEYWTLSNQYDAIKLDSLIFDFKTVEARKIEWNTAKLLEIKSSFEKIASDGFIETIYNPVVERLNAWSDPKVKDKLSGNWLCPIPTNHDIKLSELIVKQQKMFAMLIIWAKREYEYKHPNIKHITPLRNLTLTQPNASFKKSYTKITTTELDDFFAETTGHQKNALRVIEYFFKAHGENNYPSGFEVFSKELNNPNSSMHAYLAEYKKYVVQYITSLNYPDSKYTYDLSCLPETFQN